MYICDLWHGFIFTFIWCLYGLEGSKQVEELRTNIDVCCLPFQELCFSIDGFISIVGYHPHLHVGFLDGCADLG